MTEIWSTAPICFVTRPCCPMCGHERRIVIRSMAKENDDSRTQRVICRRCSSRYLIVSEKAGEDFLEPLPKNGESSEAKGKMTP